MSFSPSVDRSQVRLTDLPDCLGTPAGHPVQGLAVARPADQGSDLAISPITVTFECLQHQENLYHLHTQIPEE